VRLSLSNELDILFSPSIRIQAQTIKPETVDALAVNEAVGALLLLMKAGQSARKKRVERWNNGVSNPHHNKHAKQHQEAVCKQG
jgi:hypothetical protein